MPKKANNKFSSVKIPKEINEDMENKQKLTWINIGKYKIIISDKELQKLQNCYRKYVQKEGVGIGFFNYILNIGL